MGGAGQLTINNGDQSLYVIGNPQITFFKAVYRRHTNFAIESIDLTGNTTPTSIGNAVTYVITKGTGDLISNMWVEAKLSSTGISTGNYANWTNNTGAALIKESEFYIGGQSIERHTSLWYDVSNELMDHNNKEHIGLNKHSCRNTYLKSNNGVLPSLHLNIPLKFWFNRNVGMALPICALHKNEIKMKITYRNFSFLVNKSNGDNTNKIEFIEPTSDTIKLYADYIYLDTEEKRRFSQSSHEYLIEQVQMGGHEDLVYESNVKLNFSHPVKELIWVIRQKNAYTEGDSTATTGTTVDATQNNNLKFKNNLVGTTQKNDYFNYSLLPLGTGAGLVKDLDLGYLYTNNYGEWFKGCKLQVNGADRFSERNPYYFRTIQPTQSGHKIPSKHIYCYSFALNAEDHQPSGTINYSRVESSKLVFNTLQGKDETDNSVFITVFAIYYNVLRIQGGIGGIAYSN